MMMSALPLPVAPFYGKHQQRQQIMWWRRRLMLSGMLALLGIASVLQQLRLGSGLKAVYCATCSSSSSSSSSNNNEADMDARRLDANGTQSSSVPASSFENFFTFETRTSTASSQDVTFEPTLTASPVQMEQHQTPRIASFSYKEDKEITVLRMVPSNGKLQKTTGKSKPKTTILKTNETKQAAAPKKPTCVPNAAWQTQHHPTCNSLHELLLNEPSSFSNGGKQVSSSFRLLGSGASSDAWRVGGDDDPVVVKTLRIRRKIDEYNIIKTQREAVMLDKLTPSPSVIDIYGYCGITGIFEYADGGNLREDALRHDLPPLRKLEIAVQAAEGVAATHATDYANRSTIVHRDIKADQFVSVKGRYKLNDFNIARMIDRNASDPSLNCLFFGVKIGRDRSPEEAMRIPLTEKMDVYFFGNALYTLLTRQMPFHNLGRDEAGALLRKGTLPAMNKTILADSDPVISVLRNATFWCHTHNPDQRPTMQAVLTYLQNALREHSQ